MCLDTRATVATGDTDILAEQLQMARTSCFAFQSLPDESGTTRVCLHYHPVP